MKERYLTVTVEVTTFLCIFFATIQGALFAIGFLILMDTFTGIWSSINKDGVKSVTSRRAGRIIAKFILYPLAIIVSKVAQDYLAPAIPWVDVTAGILAMVEVKSIFENMSGILGFDLWIRVKKVIWKDKEEA
jgi:hypothetical protein